MIKLETSTNKVVDNYMLNKGGKDERNSYANILLCTSKLLDALYNEET